MTRRRGDAAGAADSAPLGNAARRSSEAQSAAAMPRRRAATCCSACPGERHWIRYKRRVMWGSDAGWRHEKS